MWKTCKAPAHVRIGWYRSVSNIPQAYAIGCFMDELAHAAGKDTVRFLLESLGGDRRIEMTATGALKAVENQQFDAVLMDCQMPELDGFEATGRLRAREALTPGAAHLPVIALTASATRDERERCAAVGMDDFLCKPFDREQLTAVLARIVALGLVRPRPAEAPVLAAA